MKVNYGVEIPEKSKGVSKVAEFQPLKEFVDGTHVTMSFGYDTAKEAQRRATAIRNIVKRNKYAVDVISRGCDVYVKKVNGKIKK